MFIRKEFEREVYKDILRWKETQDTALLLSGPRQVGKTFLLRKLGREEFKHCVYINLTKKKDRDRFEQACDEINIITRGWSSMEDFPWFRVLKLYDSIYEDSGDTLVIIDEIQQSSLMFERIRELRRSLHSRITLTGSYLGRIRNPDDFWYSAGDITEIEMSALSYVEFLKANDLHKQYSEISSYDLTKLTVVEKGIYNEIERIYDVYLMIGGYPDVVHEWLRTKNIDQCRYMVEQIINAFYRESSEYFTENMSKFLWDKTMRMVITSIVSRITDLDVRLSKNEPVDDYKPETGVIRDENSLMVRRKDRVSALRWLSDCLLIGEAGIYEDMEKLIESARKLRFFVMDPGVLSVMGSWIPNLREDDLKGIAAENFVYLYLRTQLGGLFRGRVVMSYMHPTAKAEIDFVMMLKDKSLIGIEVKSFKGGVKSGERALKKGYIKKLIKLQDTFGSIEGDRATIPIFAVDKMNGFFLTGDS